MRTRDLCPPMLAASMAVAAGIALDRLTDALDAWMWAALATCASASVFVLSRTPRRERLASSLAFVFLAAGWNAYRSGPWDESDLARSMSEEAVPAWVRGVLTTVPEFRPGTFDDGSTRTEIRLTAVHDRGDWRPADGRAILTISGNRADLSAGDAVEAAGKLGLIRGPRNPGERDMRPALRARRIGLRMSVDDPEGIVVDPSARGWPMTRMLGRLRAWSHRTLVGRLPEDVAPLAAALLLGRRGEVDPEVVDAFGMTGTTHLLAISGLHMQVMAVVLLYLGLLMGLPRSRSMLLVAIAVVGYATLVGWMPSVSRSAVMTLVACLAQAVGREPRPGNVLGLAALATLIAQPADLFHPGWQLSFLAVGALIWGVDPPARWLGRLSRSGRSDESLALDELERRYEPRWLRRAKRMVKAVGLAYLASTVVCLATAPLTLWWFNVVSPVGLLLNPPLIVITDFALVFAGLTLLLGWAGPLGDLLAWSCAELLRLTVWAVTWGEALPTGHFFLPAPPVAWLIAGYGLLAVIRVSTRPDDRQGLALLFGGGLAAGALWLGVGDTPSTPEADILAVGHGLSVVVETSDGHIWLYDCGKSRDPNVGRRVIAPALWSRGVRRIDGIILSHADSDHLNGLPDLLDRFDVEAVYVNPATKHSTKPEAAALMKLLDDRGVRVVELAAGARLELGDGLGADVLHPPPGWPIDGPDNDGSLVLDLNDAAHGLLLTGDLDASGLEEVVRVPPPRRFDAVMAPHHGGKTANPDWFYDWSGARTVIASQDPPRAGTRDALAEIEGAGRPTLRTWRDGAIRLAWNPDGLRVAPFREAARQRPAAAPRRTSVGGTLLLGIMALAGLTAGLLVLVAVIAVEWGAWAMVVPRRPPGSTDPMPPPWESVEIGTEDGVRLRGWWRESDAPSSRVAILLHGMGETGPAMAERAELLLANGWDVCLPDSRAFGRSGGRFASFGARESGDVRRWIDWIEERRRPTSRILIWGRSMGAAVAARTASEDRRVSAIILEVPYHDLASSVAVRLGRSKLPCPGLLARALLARAGAIAGGSLRWPRPLDMAPDVAAPSLLLVGGRDRLVPRSSSDRLTEALGGFAEIAEVPDADHAEVFDQGGPELYRRIGEFLAAVER